MKLRSVSVVQGLALAFAIVTGYPTDATENALQANIIAAGHGK